MRSGRATWPPCERSVASEQKFLLRAYAYTPSTNWIAGHSNADGSAVLNQYDVLGRLTSISAANGSKTAINTYSFTYDAAGQRTQEASTVGTRNFNYDDQRQLTSAYRIDNNNNPVPSYTYNYSFDSIGNWTKLISPAGEADISSNGLNQYIKFMGSAITGTQTPTYDVDGNMLTDGKGNTYVYDEENRLVEADTPNASVPKTISVYDGLSRRVEKRTYDTGGNLVTTTRYLYDGLLPIAEYDANNNLVRSYTRGLDLSGTLQGAGGIGGLLAVTDSTGSYSYFTDGNGNITDLTNVYGTVVSHSEYDPFGNVFASAGSFQQPYGWSSKENDRNGLVYYLYRFYNPSLGRWVNRDPYEEEGVLNLYNSTQNSPIIIFDRLGLSASSSWVQNNCFSTVIPVVEGALYAEYGVSLKFNLEKKSCDCCNLQTKEFIEKGSREYKGTLSVEVGFGLGEKFDLFGESEGGVIKGPQVKRTFTGAAHKRCGEPNWTYRGDVEESVIGGFSVGLGAGPFGATIALALKLKLDAGVEASAHEMHGFARGIIIPEYTFTYKNGIAIEFVYNTSLDNGIIIFDKQTSSISY